MIDDVVAAWRADAETSDRVAYSTVLPARTAQYDEMVPLHPRLGEALAERGVERLYRHQAKAIATIRQGRHTVLAAGTASGKSLAYQVPIAEASLEDPKATSLLVFPTKALAQDQHGSLYRLGIEGLVSAIYDGDTDTEDRAWARRHATALLTNPDMLHVGILPNHRRWAQFLGRLRFVVLDEVHVLRGVFGSHVAGVMRRLLRLAHHYGAEPTLIGSSATIGNPGELMSAIIGGEVVEVVEDGSPSGRRHVVLWDPEFDEETERRRSSLAETTDVFVDLVGRRLHTIAFTRSRKATELVYRWARDRLPGELAERVAPYRAGYLPRERREVEQALFTGELLGVTATSALELGIDVGSLDAAIVSSFPGTLSSFRQQIGRAGRRSDDALAVLVLGEDALDRHYLAHPDELFDRPAEAAVVNPSNPHILGAQLGCAAFEKPLTPDDHRWFGDALEELAPDLVDSGDLRVRAGALVWAGRGAPAPGIDIRTARGAPFTIVDEDGTVIGSVDEGRAHSQTHPGAVYLHQGDSYVVTDLDLELRQARVTRADPGYFTEPHEETDIALVSIAGSGRVGRFRNHHGQVEVAHQVLGYRKKSLNDGTTIGHEYLDLPMRTYRTQALWFDVPDDIISDARVSNVHLPGALHAAEHTAISVLPLFAICDRWDIGGLSTAYHPAFAGAGFFIYDGYPGGAGIAPVGFAVAQRHLEATLEILETCPCRHGCPSCVQSPKCGNFNEPLEKGAAAALIRVGLGG